MIECNICKCRFNLNPDRHYIARDNGNTGMAAAFGPDPEEILYDAVDCPDCGCQIILQERKRKV